MAEKTPWAGWLAAAFAAGLAPCDFWRISVREWRAMTGAQANALGRAAFDALAARFPDNNK